MYPHSSYPGSTADGKCPIYQNACLKDGAIREAKFLSKETKPVYPFQSSPHMLWLLHFGATHHGNFAISKCAAPHFFIISFKDDIFNLSL